MIRIAALALCLIAAPATADEPLFRAGDVLCVNHDPATQTCKSIGTTTRIEGDLRHSEGRRYVALPTTTLTMFTRGVSRIDGTRACVAEPFEPPVFAPSGSVYEQALTDVHLGKRAARLARNTCYDYRRCGEVYHLYRDDDEMAEPELLATVTILRAGDPRIPGLTLRDRTFAINEDPPEPCASTG